MIFLDALDNPLIIYFAVSDFFNCVWTNFNTNTFVTIFKLLLNFFVSCCADYSVWNQLPGSEVGLGFYQFLNEFRSFTINWWFVYSEAIENFQFVIEYYLYILRTYFFIEEIATTPVKVEYFTLMFLMLVLILVTLAVGFYLAFYFIYFFYFTTWDWGFASVVWLDLNDSFLLPLAIDKSEKISKNFKSSFAIVLNFIKKQKKWTFSLDLAYSKAKEAIVKSKFYDTLKRLKNNHEFNLKKKQQQTTTPCALETKITLTLTLKITLFCII